MYFLVQDGEEGKETERKRSRSPEKKRSRSRSVDGSFSGDSKRRKTDDKDIREEGRSGSSEKEQLRSAKRKNIRVPEVK